jgi:hypothetical protein
MPERFDTPTNSPDVNFNLTRDGIKGFTDNNSDANDNAVESFATPAASPTVNFNLTRDSIRGFAART